jgi:hypothetical protein
MLHRDHGRARDRPRVSMRTRRSVAGACHLDHGGRPVQGQRKRHYSGEFSITHFGIPQAETGESAGLIFRDNTRIHCAAREAINGLGAWASGRRLPRRSGGRALRPEAASKAHRFKGTVHVAIGAESVQPRTPRGRLTRCGWRLGSGHAAVRPARKVRKRSRCRAPGPKDSCFCVATWDLLAELSPAFRRLPAVGCACALAAERQR